MHDTVVRSILGLDPSGRDIHHVESSYTASHDTPTNQEAGDDMVPNLQLDLSWQNPAVMRARLEIIRSMPNDFLHRIGLSQEVIDKVRYILDSVLAPFFQQLRVKEFPEPQGTIPSVSIGDEDTVMESMTDSHASRFEV